MKSMQQFAIQQAVHNDLIPFQDENIMNSMQLFENVI